MSKEPEEVYSPHTIVIEGAGPKKIEAPTVITREGHSVGKTEEFKRSSHNDFANNRELIASSFSGIRDNQMVQQRELWLDGNMVAAMSYFLISQGEGHWDRLYADALGLGKVESISR